MIARFIRWSIVNRFLVLLATLMLGAWGVYSVLRTPLDALPDLSDVQVIVYTEYPGQAPQVVEDQVTYPLTTAMLAVPKSKVVRGFSFFGVSFVYVIFEDGVDPYWARSRVLEFLNSASQRLPAGVSPTIGPDATGVGWVYQYAVMAQKRNLAELRTTQDWQVRFAVAKAEGLPWRLPRAPELRKLLTKASGRGGLAPALFPAAPAGWPLPKTRAAAPSAGRCTPPSRICCARSPRRPSLPSISPSDCCAAACASVMWRRAPCWASRVPAACFRCRCARCCGRAVIRLLAP